MVDWWSETEHAIVECLARDGAMSPGELGHHVGISESEATMFLCMLEREGKVRIRVVDLQGPSPCPLPRGERDPRGLAAPVGAGSEWTSWDA
jgi:hypothetical protein